MDVVFPCNALVVMRDLYSLGFRLADYHATSYDLDGSPQDGNNILETYQARAASFACIMDSRSHPLLRNMDVASLV